MELRKRQVLVEAIAIGVSVFVAVMSPIVGAVVLASADDQMSPTQFGLLFGWTNDAARRLAFVVAGLAIINTITAVKYRRRPFVVGTTFFVFIVLVVYTNALTMRAWN